MQRTANSLTYAEAGGAARLGPRRPGGVGGGVDLGYEACGVGHWIGARSRAEETGRRRGRPEWKRMQESTQSCSGPIKFLAFGGNGTAWTVTPSAFNSYQFFYWASPMNIFFLKERFLALKKRINRLHMYTTTTASTHS